MSTKSTIEDNDYVRSIMTSTLRAQGYSVVQAPDGIEGMRAWETQRARVCLVVLDLDLPKRDGLSCLREIHVVQPEIPVIVVTGCVDIDREAETRSIARLLRKPFQMSELAAAVADALARARPEHEVMV